MNLASAKAFVALSLLCSMSRAGLAQDSTLATRHLLSLDLSRVQPFRRAYDMIVHTADSAVVIGERLVALTPAEYSGAPAWLLVETRTGLVPAAESLYIAPDFRPLHWSSTLGIARLGLEFAGDSIYGVATMPTGRQNVVAAGRTDLLVSQSMTEAVLALSPLAASWSDSVGVLDVDGASHSVLPGQLAVVGEEDTQVDSVLARPTWVTTLRAGERQVLYWIAKDSGEAIRSRQSLPSVVGGRDLEYRLRTTPAAEGAPPRQ